MIEGQRRSFKNVSINDDTKKQFKQLIDDFIERQQDSLMLQDLLNQSLKYAFGINEKEKLLSFIYQRERRRIQTEEAILINNSAVTIHKEEDKK
jgi:hypothetical protein